MNFPEEKIRSPEWHKAEGCEEDTSDPPTVVVKRETKKGPMNTDDLNDWCWISDLPF
jgi:hypothetical protein